MKRGSARRFLIASGLAVLISVIDTAGWREWGRITNSLGVNPEVAAARLAGSGLVSLPSAVVRTRRLTAGDLEFGPMGVLTEALANTGNRQRRWVPADASGFVNLAGEELLRGRATQSILALSEALLRDPTSAMLHRLQALFLFSIGDRGSALEELAVAEAIAPGFREPEIDLTAEDQESVRIEGLRLRPSFYPRGRTEAALALARELRKVGDDEASRLELEEFRGRPDVEIELARWMIDDGEYRGAIENLQPIASRAANPRSTRASAWSVIAIARELDGDADGALAAADQALVLDPDSASPYTTLAGLAQGRGDLDAALVHLRRAWGLRPGDTGLLTRIAWVAEQAGKPADALLALGRAVEIDPGTPHLSTLLVELQLRTGNYTEAAVSLSRALDRHPTDVELLRLADRLPREVGIR